MPGMGHSRNDLADETLRAWPVHSYLIVYRPAQRPIEIVRVVSGFRDLRPKGPWLEDGLREYFRIGPSNHLEPRATGCRACHMTEDDS